MKLEPINAEDGAPALGTSYVQAMKVSEAQELLFISGQIGVGPDLVAPPQFDEQASLVWSNIDAQLRAAGMTKDNLVKVTIFLSDRIHIPAYRKARDTYLQGKQVALTCIISDIFDDAWLLEIEAIAAR